MTEPRHVAVIDIGKTNAKVALVDLATLAEVDVRRTPNVVLRDGLYPHYDTEALWSFILQSLAELHRSAGIDAISITTHGATAALLDPDGALAMPILDYEFDGPDTLAAGYDKVRPGFAETGAPRLPIGLNLGAQLYWQQQRFPAQFAKTANVVMYPQYWGYRLTGALASEATSLGCHTDLWSPHRRTFSPMVVNLGWDALMPPLRNASDKLGTLRPDLAARTGIPLTTPVHVGIHDSNASLLPHLLARPSPFTVLSTGTWVVALAVGSSPQQLDPARDTLINVNALGDPVPSSRFMGGRENELLGQGLPDPTPAEVEAVLTRRVLLLPAAVQGSGPFPATTGHWTSEPNTPGERRAAVSFYLAMMSATCLDLIGARGPTIIEGPFAANPELVAMLRAATGRDVVAEGAGTGTSIGAALLAVSGKPTLPAAAPVALPPESMPAYAAAWRVAVA